MFGKMGAFGLLLIFCLVAGLLASATPVGAVGIGVSPPKLDFGTVGRNGSAQETAQIFNLDNSTPMNYTIASNSTGVSANPSHGVIDPKSNATITFTASAGDVKDGAYNGMLLVNSTSQSNFGGASVLPAIAVKYAYVVSGNASPHPAQAAPTAGISPAIAAVLILGVIIVVTALYAHKRR